MSHHETVHPIFAPILIAAAPEMYEALCAMRAAQLQKFVAWNMEPDRGERVYAIQCAKNAEANAHKLILLALAKAEGVQS